MLSFSFALLTTSIGKSFATQLFLTKFLFNSFAVNELDRFVVVFVLLTTINLWSASFVLWSAWSLPQFLSISSAYANLWSCKLLCSCVCVGALSLFASVLSFQWPCHSQSWGFVWFRLESVVIGKQMTNFSYSLPNTKGKCVAQQCKWGYRFCAAVRWRARGVRVLRKALFGIVWKKILQ